MKTKIKHVIETKKKYDFSYLFCCLMLDLLLTLPFYFFPRVLEHNFLICPIILYYTFIICVFGNTLLDVIKSDLNEYYKVTQVKHVVVK